jgi:hypothetical protein
MSSQPRQPAGTSSGGRFAPGRKSRAVIQLTGESEVIELGNIEPEFLQAIKGEAASMPYEIGTRYVQARILEVRARETARAIWREAESSRKNGLNDFLENGGTPDKIEVNDTVYYRAKPGREFSEPYSMMLVSDRPINDDEMQHLAQLAGYAYVSTVHGEPLGEPRRVSPYAFTLEADTTKGRGDLGDFIEQYPDMVPEGSPVRSTDRAGAGTRGTRLVEGLGEGAPQITMYFDDAIQDEPEESSETQQP